MRTFNEVRDLLDRVAYKNHWVLRIDCEVISLQQERTYIQWQFYGPCSITGVKQWHNCRKWYLSPHMTDGEIVQTAFAAALQAEEHECREFFKYDGHVIMNPHLSLEALTSRAHMTEGRAPQPA